MLYSGKVINKITGAPVVGVAVSDGRNVVLTAADGSYSLPGWERTHTVAVCALTKEDHDWFYFTDGKGGTYDFAISPADEAETFELLHVSDTEIFVDRDVEWVSFMGDLCKQKMPAFLMHTGDITLREGMRLHQEHMNYKTMGCPVRYVIGNHDYAGGTDTSVHYGEQVFEEECGPVWNSFDCAGVHCVILSIGKGSKKDMATGYTREDQWAWLKNDLEIAGKGKPLVIFEHSPGDGSEGDLDLKKLGMVAWIYGHAHTNRFDIVDDKAYICTGRAHTGGIDSSPAAARRITYKDGQLTSQMHYRRFPTAEPDEVIWQTKVHSNVLFCEPVLVGENLLVGTVDDDRPDTAGIACLEAATGKVKWFTPVGGNGVPNNLAVDGEKVYCQDTVGKAFCMELATGRILWAVETTEKTNAKMAVVISGDALICGKPGKPVALNKHTGEIIWEFSGEARKGGKTPARTVVDEKHGYTFICGQWGVLRCLKTATGEEVWYRAEKPLWYRNGTPCVDGEYIYAGGFDMLLKMNIHTGETVAVCNVGEAARAMGAPIVETDGDMNVCGGMTVDGDVLYCPTAGSGVVAVDKNEMKVLHRYPAGPAAILTAPYVKQGAEMVESRPLIRGEELIFTALDGKVYFYNKDTAQLIKTISMGAASLVAPIVTEDAVYTADFDGHVSKF